MPEVPKVGANPTPPPPERKETSSPDRFQEHMRKDKVRETDPEEQSKRKKPQEAEEEKKAEETQKKEITSKKQETEAEVALSFSVKTTGVSKPSRELQGEATSAPEKEGPQIEKPLPKKVEGKEKTEEKAPLSIPSELKPIESVTQASQAPSANLGAQTRVPPVAKEAPAPVEEKVEKPTVAAGGPKEPVLPERAKIKEKTVSFETALASLSTSSPVQTSEPKVTKAYANFTAQMLDIFERMVGVMTVLKSSGMTQTTIHLTGPQFASSIFNGCQITIQEFSSAPKSFNIQFVGSPQAVQAFEAKIPMINTAFSTGNYDFKVNRLEANLSRTEGPILHRKEEPSGTWDQDQQGKKQK
ncbi:MAG: hypothetical protein HKM07_03660 [Chlamydiae bacterium]|nr:hypothetical protein [Chlamydiota bacterium]